MRNYLDGALGRNLAHQALERQLADEHLGRLLVLADLAQADGACAAEFDFFSKQSVRTSAPGTGPGDMQQREHVYISRPLAAVGVLAVLAGKRCLHSAQKKQLLNYSGVGTQDATQREHVSALRLSRVMKLFSRAYGACTRGHLMHAHNFQKVLGMF